MIVSFPSRLFLKLHNTCIIRKSRVNSCDLQFSTINNKSQWVGKSYNQKNKLLIWRNTLQRIMLDITCKPSSKCEREKNVPICNRNWKYLRTVCQYPRDLGSTRTEERKIMALRQNSVTQNIFWFIVITCHRSSYHDAQASPSSLLQIWKNKK